MNNLIKCPGCKTEYENQPEKCNRCGYPFGGSDKEKSHFVAQQIIKKGKLADTKESIGITRAILFVIAGFNIVFPFFNFADVNVQHDNSACALSIFIGLVFLICGFTVKKDPFISILIPFILLILSYAINAIIEPSTLFNGIIIKLFFIGSMTYSLINIIKSEKIKKESEFFANKDYK